MISITTRNKMRQIELNGKFDAVPAMVEATTNISVDVMIERVLQDIQWGGSATDDTRTPADWSQYIHNQLSRMFQEPGNERDRFVKVAALAFAAIAAIDRRAGDRSQERLCDCPACRLEAVLRSVAPGGDGVRVMQLDAASDLGEMLAELLSGRRPRSNGEPG